MAGLKQSHCSKAHYSKRIYSSEFSCLCTYQFLKIENCLIERSDLGPDGGLLMCAVNYSEASLVSGLTICSYDLLSIAWPLACLTETWLSEDLPESSAF